MAKPEPMECEVIFEEECDAFHILLRRAVAGWDKYCNLETGVVNIPINDWDRAQSPVLGAATAFEFNVHSFRLTGENRRILSRRVC